MHAWDVPAVVLTLVAALSAPAKTLGEAAQREALRRLLTPHATTKVTNEDIARFAPRTPPPPAAAAEPPSLAEVAKQSEAEKDKAGKPEEDETWWRNRMDAARKALSRDEVLADALQSRINALTTDFVNRDDPAQRARIAQQRSLALDELDRMKKQIDADGKLITEIQDDARKKNVPPGWIR